MSHGSHLVTVTSRQQGAVQICGCRGHTVIGTYVHPLASAIRAASLSYLIVLFFFLLLGPCRTTIPPFLLDEQSSATKLVFSLSYRKRDGLGFATTILVEEQDVPGRFNQVSRPSAACSALPCPALFYDALPASLPEVNYCWRHVAPNMGHPCSRSNRPISNINVTIPGHLLPLRPSPWIAYRPPRQ